MKVAAGQFTVTEKPEHNISIISGFTSEAARNHARILLLPEGLIARSDDDPRYTADHAQTIDGPFVTALRGISEANNLAIMGTVHLHEDTATCRTTVSSSSTMAGYFSNTAKSIGIMRSASANPIQSRQGTRFRCSWRSMVGSSV